MTRHPAKFSDPILEAMADMLVGVKGVALDPFAGTGKVYVLSRPDLRVTGVEIEPEWANLDPRTVVGDALSLPLRDSSLDAIITSPTYGNRMADHHDARDSSKRNTYKHAIGRDLHPNNSGAMQWGSEYRRFHMRAWLEAYRVTKKGGLMLVNLSDHIRKGEVQPVTDWHVRTLEDIGYKVREVRTVYTSRYREGSNSSVRVPFESVVSLTRQ